MRPPDAQTVQAFVELYEANRPLLLAVARRIVRDDSDAEDVVQTVFSRVWLRPWLPNDRDMRYWLIILTKHAAIDVLRRRSREELSKLRVSDIVAVEEPVFEVVLQRLRRQWLWAALEQLPKAQRELIFAALRSGASHRGLARSNQLPVGTVKSRIRMGIARLRKSAARLG